MKSSEEEEERRLVRGHRARRPPACPVARDERNRCSSAAIVVFPVTWRVVRRRGTVIRDARRSGTLLTVDRRHFNSRRFGRRFSCSRHGTDLRPVRDPDPRVGRRPDGPRLVRARRAQVEEVMALRSSPKSGTSPIAHVVQIGLAQPLPSTLVEASSGWRMLTTWNCPPWPAVFQGDAGVVRETPKRERLSPWGAAPRTCAWLLMRMPTATVRCRSARLGAPRDLEDRPLSRGRSDSSVIAHSALVTLLVTPNWRWHGAEYPSDPPHQAVTVGNEVLAVGLEGARLVGDPAVRSQRTDRHPPRRLAQGRARGVSTGPRMQNRWIISSPSASGLPALPCSAVVVALAPVDVHGVAARGTLRRPRPTMRLPTMPPKPRH